MQVTKRGSARTPLGADSARRRRRRPSARSRAPRHRARARSAAGRGRRSGSREVAANLLAAAQLHTPRARPVHVEVAARRDQAILAVTNEGRGIDPERAPHPFEASSRDADRRSGSRAADARSSPSPIIAASIHADKSTATERSAAGDACNRHDAGQLPTRASSLLCRRRPIHLAQVA
jgi:hypothetical protein